MKLSTVYLTAIRLNCLLMFVLISTWLNIVHAQLLKNNKNAVDIKIEYCLNQEPDQSIEFAIGCRYLPRKELPRASLSESTAWIRLQIDQSKTSHPAWAVHIGPHFIGEIEFYEKINDEWHRQIAGNKTPFENSKATLGGYVFEIKPREADIETVYFRIRMSGLSSVLIDVAPLDQSGFDALSQQLGIGIHIGAILLILAFSVFNYLMHPSALMFRFCCLTLLLLFSILGGSGLLARFIFDQSPWLDNVFFNWMICLRLACWVWVAQAFLDSYQPPEWYRIGCKAIYLIVFISLILVVKEKIVWLQHLLLTGFIATTIIQIVAIQKTSGIQKNYQHTLLLGYIFASILVLLTVFLAAYPTDSGYTVVYATRIVDFVTPVVLLAIVGFRNRLIHKQFAEVKTANLLMNTRLEYERKLLKERRVLLDMLTHELKNPLASIALAVGSLKKHFTHEHPQEQRRIHNVDQSIKNMDLIIERCSLMNQVDQNEIAPSIRDVDISTCISSLVDERNDSNRFQLKLDQFIKVKADDYFLKIIFTNLIENAIKYSPDKSVVEVQIQKIEKNNEWCAQLAVMNDVGECGIPDYEKVFSRFYRNPHAQKITGSGLGLHLVSELCRLLHFSIGCETVNGKVAFVVEMPLSEL